ncbi:MAG: HNH endonuclease [Nitrososphaerota archaeon]|nr:HNH endonuclease [Nitrososphaerota archaeon]
MIPKPRQLENCNSWSRTFPESWKSAYFRRVVKNPEIGYECPMCHKCFRGLKGYKQLHADHIRPYSSFSRYSDNLGPTTWENLQLLCSQCNLKKYDFH